MISNYALMNLRNMGEKAFDRLNVIDRVAQIRTVCRQLSDTSDIAYFEFVCINGLVVTVGIETDKSLPKYFVRFDATCFTTKQQNNVTQLCSKLGVDAIGLPMFTSSDHFYFMSTPSIFEATIYKLSKVLKCDTVAEIEGEALTDRFRNALKGYCNGITYIGGKEEGHYPAYMTIASYLPTDTDGTKRSYAESGKSIPNDYDDLADYDADAEDEDEYDDSIEMSTGEKVKFALTVVELITSIICLGVLIYKICKRKKDDE